MVGNREVRIYMDEEESFYDDFIEETTNNIEDTSMQVDEYFNSDNIIIDAETGEFLSDKYVIYNDNIIPRIHVKEDIGDKTFEIFYE